MNSTMQQQHSSLAPSSSQSQGASRATPASPVSPPAPAKPSHDAIARRANDIYNRNGQMPGHCKQNWLQAERELYGASQREGPERMVKNFDDVMPSNTGPGHSTPISANPPQPTRGPAKP